MPFNFTLLTRLIRGHRVRLILGLAVVVIWSLLFPVIYEAFKGQAVNVPGKPSGLTNFSTLASTVAIGFIHPISIALFGMLSAGLAVGAISGERQRGTLELLLAKPIGRRTIFLTVLLEGWIGSALVSAAYVLGTIAGAQIAGVSSELPVEYLPALWAFSTLFWGLFTTIAAAASSSFDRTAPAMAITVSFIMANYIVEVIGSFWDVAEPYQYLSLFHHIVPADLLTGTNDFSAAAIFGAIAVAAALWGLIVFPRRDLAAPN